jgi:hypothetical protein
VRSQSDYPAEIEKTFNASFDKTWDAVSEIVKMSNGVIITSDKSSGLVTYAIPDKETESKIYINVYLKSNPNANTTNVFLFSKTRTGPYLKEIDRVFFEKLKTLLGDGNG